MKNLVFAALAVLLTSATPLLAEEKCGASDAACKQEQSLYRCPMHPEVTSTDPKAKCPKCGMDLEKDTSKSGEDSGKEDESHSSHDH